MKKQIGDKIKQLRKENNLNQKELSKIINVTQASLSDYENGNKSISLDVLIRISDYFNVSLDWLCGLDRNISFNNGTDLLKIFLKIKEISGFNYDIKVNQENIGFGDEIYKTTLTFIGKPEPQLRLEPKEIFDVNAFSEFMRDYGELENKLISLGDNELSEDYKKMWLEKKLQEYLNYKIIGE